MACSGSWHALSACASSWDSASVIDIKSAKNRMILILQEKNKREGVKLTISPSGFKKSEVYELF